MHSSGRVEAAVIAWLDRSAGFLVDRWLALFNGTVVLYVTLPVLAPLLMVAGARDWADVIYWLYSFACNQLPTHSWFLFGYQMAYCQRDTAIYLSLLVGGLAYARWRYWTRGLPFWMYVLLALPIAIDGGTATLGWRDSTPLLRTLTGTLFGLASAWYLYPLMDRALAPFCEFPTQGVSVEAHPTLPARTRR
jgi:uncharacterized membrane protein